MRIKLKHNKTGKIKYITRPEGYPTEPGDTIRFRGWKNNDDTWVVVKIF